MREPSMWRLSRLEMENFRQYREAVIDFSNDESKIFTVVKGENGNGKTNIMNAITWCLYGSEKRSGQKSNKGYLPIVNTGALKDKQGAGLVTTKVKVILADTEGDKISIERKLVLYITEKSNETEYNRKYKIYIPSKSVPDINKTLQLHGEGGWTTTDYFDMKINEILPEDLATYFLFDGEKLESFFKQVDDTKRGIKDVSQVNLIEKSMSTLGKVVSKMRKEVKNESPDASKLKIMFDNEVGNLRKIEVEIQELDHAIKNMSEEREAIEENIVKLGGDAGQYQKDARAARNDLEKAESMYRESKDKTKKYVLENLYILKLLPQIQNALDQIKLKTKEGELPPKIRDTFLNEILKKGSCICGGDISQGTTSREKVESHLKKAQYSSISELCTDLKFVLTPMLNVDDVLDNLNKIEKMEYDHMEMRDKLDKKCRELERKLKGVDLKEVQRLQNTKITLQNKIDSHNRKLGGCHRKKDDVSKLIASLDQKWVQEVRKEKRFKHIIDKREFCDTALNVLKTANEELLDDVRNKVQSYTKKYFLEFLWKKNTYDDVVIDEDYNITAHHVDGYDVREDLSAGEKLVLALSFMAALRKITGFKFPLVIDSPLGKISGKPRHNIAKALPSFLKGTQVTMLVTNSEYDEEIDDEDANRTFPSTRKTLGKYVGAHYLIDYSDKERQSSVRKGELF